MPRNIASNHRRAMIKRLFQNEVPRLWCPLLTHYTADGEIDEVRIEAHLSSLIPMVSGLLVPGSTGDGWEISDSEACQLCALIQKLSPRYALTTIIGALKTDCVQAMAFIRQMMNQVKASSGCDDPLDALAHRQLCGFAICSPSGSDLDQSFIQEKLTSVFQIGVPIALYQLPQVTQNNVSPGVARYLADEFENFCFFKDSGGTDEVVLSGHLDSRIITVRGAEGKYAQSLKAHGGSYDGLLLSSANCFPEAIERIISSSTDEALLLSDQLSRLISEMFSVVQNLPYGNVFTNANKAMDHFMAYGPKASKMRPPRLHSGNILPKSCIRTTESLLKQYNMLPYHGYLE